VKSSIVYNLFHEYYCRDFHLDGFPNKMSRREFGFALFSEGVVVRHKRFETFDELKAFLEANVPADAYYSCAYYEHPDFEMEKKGWLGADLIFDIDADHIPTACDRIHDEWVCVNCKFEGKGIIPEKCPICGSEKFDVKTWPCENCLASAKDETIKLLDFLIFDFGFSKDEIRLFFSGNRGYHIHVEGEAVQELDAMARKEIVDYISGMGLDVTFHAPVIRKTKKGIEIGKDAKFSSFGWSQRLLRGIRIFLASAKEEDLERIGLRRETAEILMQNKDVLLKGLVELGVLFTPKGVGAGTWLRIMKHVAGLQSAKIDTVVTTDVHRLIRLPNTLNSKTGFKKAEVPISEIDKFDPFKEALAFKSGTLTVKVSSAPKFRIGDQTFGPYRNRKVELPTAAALLLICRERAEVIE